MTQEIFIITGVPGVGKSAILRVVETCKDCKIVNYGDIMFRMAKGRGMVRNKDEIRKLRRDVQLDIQKKAFDEILHVKSDKLVIDSHASILTGDGSYLSGFSTDAIRDLKPKTIIIVESNVRSIMGRRQRDKRRQRDSETAEDIEMHQQINRMLCASLCAASKANLCIIKNVEGKLGESRKKLMKVLG